GKLEQVKQSKKVWEQRISCSISSETGQSSLHNLNKNKDNIQPNKEAEPLEIERQS
ncbi:15181_t:CDS:2, partial [Gigaspora rosea]